MATFDYVDLPLYEDSFYSYNVSLEGDSYNLEFEYNEFSRKWFLSVYTEDQEAVILGVALIPEYPILSNYIIPNLSGFIWLYPIQGVGEGKYKEFPENIDQYYTMKYIYNYIEG